MPGLLQIQTDLKMNPTAVWSANTNPEDVELWLPSQISADRRRVACAEGLPHMELRLRTAQCSSSLQGLRQALRIKTRMVYFKNKNIRGQREGTRSRSIIDRVHKRAIQFVQKYRAARRAKLSLEGPGEWESTYRELRNEDIRSFASGKPKKLPNRRGIWEDGDGPTAPEQTDIFNESDEDESDPNLNDGTEAGPPPKKKRKLGTGETRKQLSWIWRTVSFSLEGDENDDILRAEWARSRARVRRATEEVLLVREEMRRVLACLEWSAAQWDLRKTARGDVGMELNEGLAAYAVEQADLQRTFSSTFKTLWKTPLADVDGLLHESDPPYGDDADNAEDNDDNGDDNDDNANDNDEEVTSAVG